MWGKCRSATKGEPSAGPHDIFARSESVIVGYYALLKAPFPLTTCFDSVSGERSFMARNDGIHRTSARNARLTAAKIGNAQQHNEREKASYVNQDIVLERTQMNVHFKTPADGYMKLFDQMVEEGTISTRGLKADAEKFGELIFDVNSAYFYNHGGYEFAKQFYADAYKAAIDIVGGEQYILSAVMHADERNRAMSEALGQDVHHYHLHVVYIPVVEKQILWSKRCKDKSLVGTVKETIMQVSMSKKWDSKPVFDEQGNMLLTKSGKKVLQKSYSVLQDDFFEAMRKAGYPDIERGERGSSEEHLTVTQFKVEREQDRLSHLEQEVVRTAQVLYQMEEKTQAQEQVAMTFLEIDKMGQKNLWGKVQFTSDDVMRLKSFAKKGVTASAEIDTLKRDLADAEKEIRYWRSRYERLREQTRDFVEAMRRAPERLKQFIQEILHMNIERTEPKRMRTDRKRGIER